MVNGVAGEMRVLALPASRRGAGGDPGEAALREAMKSRKEKIDEFVSNPAIPREAKIKKLKSVRRTHTVLSALGGGVAGALAGATVAVALSGAPLLAILPALMAWKTASDAVKDGKVASYAARKAREIESQPSQSPIQGSSQIKQIPIIQAGPQESDLGEILVSFLRSTEEPGGKIEWKSSYKSGVAGVWNPKTEQVEWKSSYKSGVAGVWNPKTEQVEWKSSYKSGVAGVWNPKTEQVEWKSSYKSGVAGVWNPKTEQMEWKSSYKSGVAGVSTYRGAPTLASASFYGDDE